MTALALTGSGVADPVALDLVLDGRTVDLALGDAHTSTTFAQDMESTANLVLVVVDQQRVLTRSGILDANRDGRLDGSLRVRVEGADYLLAAVRKTGDTFTLTFEDRVVALLRYARGALRPRAGEDHVRFAKRLVRLVGFELVTPTGTGVTRSGSALDERRQREEADDRRERGIASSGAGAGAAVGVSRLGRGGAFGSAIGDSKATRHTALAGSLGEFAQNITSGRVTVKGAKATAEQIRNMEVVMGVAVQEQAGAKATLALVEACIVESTFRNLTSGHADSEGILQLRVGLHGRDVARSVTRSARKFLTVGFTGRGGAIKLATDNPEWTAGMVAATVQGPRADLRGLYDESRAEATLIVAAYGGVEPGGGQDATAAASAALVQRGTPENPNESSWDAMQRIGRAKGWRLWAVANKPYYAREQDLVRSRPRMTISEQDAAINWIDWEVSPRKKVNAAQVDALDGQWKAPPGSCVVIEGEGLADGRWLVSRVNRTRFAAVCTVELRRGTELLEPEETKEGASGGVDQGVGSVRDACQAISDQNRKYLYGGGHGKKFTAIGATDPLDCSSSSTMALWLAGVFNGDSPVTSGVLAASYGEPGRGVAWTVWANGGHVFIQSEGDGEKWRFDTASRQGDDNRESGPRVRKAHRDTDGFTARRVKGSG